MFDLLWDISSLPATCYMKEAQVSDLKTVAMCISMFQASFWGFIVFTNQPNIKQRYPATKI